MNKKLFLIFALFAVALGIFPALSYADKVMFFTPTRVLLNDDKKVEVMNITNLSSITRAYKISFQDQVMTQEGVTTSVDNFQYSAKRMLRFVPREFTLEPGERQTIRIMSRLRPETQEGEYHTHIRFLEDVSQRQKNNPVAPGQSSISAPLAYEALIPAVVSHGNVQSVIGLKDASISKLPEGNKYQIKTVVTRQGNGQGTAFLNTDYIAPDGTVTSVTPRRTVYIYREIDERKKDYDFMMPEGLPAGGTIRISVFDSQIPDATPVTSKTLSLP